VVETQTTSSQSEGQPIFRLPAVIWLLLALALAASVVSVLAGWSQMLNWLLTRPEYSYGTILPFVAAFLLWQRRDVVERLPFTGSWVGLAIALFGAALGALGKMSSVYTLEHYSVIIALYGLVLSLTGWRVFKLLWVPILILVLMVPLPEFLYKNFSAALQLLSSQIGVWVMRLLGISVYLEGNVIDLGVYKLQVAEACDGLRYLFPLMVIGFLLAYFFRAALWKRIVLFLSGIPVAILMNSLRVSTIGVMVEHWGIGMAEGFLHEFQGWVVFMISALIMLAELMVLSWIGPERRPWRQSFRLEFPAPTPKEPAATTRKVPASLYATVASLVAVGVLSFAVPERAEVVPARSSFDTYGNVIGPWTGHRQALEQVYLDQLMLDDYYIGDFVRGNSQPLNFYVAWYDSQRAGRSTHSPRSCLPGGGWEIQTLETRTLPVQMSGKPLQVNRALIRLGTQQMLVYYWFQQRGRLITDEYAAKWYLFWDELTRSRTDGALVRLVVPVPAGTAVDEADAQLVEFAGAIAPTLPRYIPD
jgi:exosortase D (VPLPA-CTERM-specific)